MEGKNGVRARKMLRRITQGLEKANIPYVLEAGTLLGVVRENRLLPWDNDLDITITRQYEESLLRNKWRFWLMGYQVCVRYYKQDRKYFNKGEVRIIKIKNRNPFRLFKKNVVLDIFLKKKIEDDYYWTVGVKAPVLKSVPYMFYEKHTQLNFEGKMYSVPYDYEGYLECHYGKDWRVPVKEWDYRTSDCSVKEFL